MPPNLHLFETGTFWGKPSFCVLISIERESLGTLGGGASLELARPSSKHALLHARRLGRHCRDGPLRRRRWRRRPLRPPELPGHRLVMQAVVQSPGPCKFSIKSNYVLKLIQLFRVRQGLSCVNGLFWPVWAGCYSQAALSLPHSKPLYAQPACGYADHEPADEEEVVARVVGEEGERRVDDVAADVGDAGGERDGADRAEPVGQEAEERREEQLGCNSIDILGTSLIMLRVLRHV